MIFLRIGFTLTNLLREEKGATVAGDGYIDDGEGIGREGEG